MPKYQVSFIIEVTSQQQAVSLRDRAKVWLEEQGATVSNWTSANMDPSWVVTGVDTADEQPFALKVRASDEEAARTIVTDEVPTRVIAEARRDSGI